MPRQIPLRAEVTEDGCHVVTSHKLNQDGYFRKRWSNAFEMFHRAMWKHHKGPIPEGYEVDHICRNRACFNVEHLRLLECSEHKSHTNRTRYADRKAQALEYWRNENPTGTALAQLFGVSFSTACMWIRGWKETT